MLCKRARPWLSWPEAPPGAGPSGGARLRRGKCGAASLCRNADGTSTSSYRAKMNHIALQKRHLGQPLHISAHHGGRPGARTCNLGPGGLNEMRFQPAGCPPRAWSWIIFRVSDCECCAEGRYGVASLAVLRSSPRRCHTAVRRALAMPTSCEGSRMPPAHVRPHELRSALLPRWETHTADPLAPESHARDNT